MKRLLLSILIILLIALTVYVMLQGVQIQENINVLSFLGLSQRNEEVDKEIANATKLVGTDYKKALSEQEENLKKLKDEKKTYDDMVTISSSDDIKVANQLEKYEIEYLWTKIGNHATSEGVNIKMDITNSSSSQTTNNSNNTNTQTTNNSNNTNTQETDNPEQMSYSASSISAQKNDTTSSTTGQASKKYNLNFTVTGDYVGIADFVYAIENDSSLGFKIEQFKLIPSGSELTATFVCKDIEIKNVSSNVVAPPKNNNQDAATLGNTTNTNTTNSTNNTNTTNNTSSGNTNSTNTQQ